MNVVVIDIPDAGPAPWVEAWRARGAVVLSPPERVGRALRHVASLSLAGRDAGRIAGRLRTRALLGAWFANTLPRDATCVIAPSLAAAEVFRTAREYGTETHLVEDLPDLADLHADLDAAAAAWPDEPLLRNHRAGARWVARQARERALADVLHVQTSVALARPSGFGVRVIPLSPRAPDMATAPFVFRLAGPAVARNGLREALAAFAAVHERDPRWVLEVRNPTFTLPPGVRPAVALSAAVVLAPTWAEANLPEVAAAGAAGIPLIATRRGAGLHTSGRFTEVQRGDVPGLAAAMRQAAQQAAQQRDMSSGRRRA